MPLKPVRRREPSGRRARLGEMRAQRVRSREIGAQPSAPVREPSWALGSLSALKVDVNGGWPSAPVLEPSWTLGTRSALPGALNRQKPLLRAARRLPETPHRRATPYRASERPNLKPSGTPKPSEIGWERSPEDTRKNPDGRTDAPNTKTLETEENSLRSQ